MKSTSMLTIDQLDAIFANLEDLIQAHKQFMSKLTTTLVNAVQTKDEVSGQCFLCIIFFFSETFCVCFLVCLFFFNIY